MRSFFDKLKKISPYIYGLSFTTFFIQLGATLVHGSGNKITAGRLMTPFALVLLRNTSDTLAIFFKILAGYLSDKFQNRTIFLLVGYGSAIIFKICFLITTLDINLQFAAILYGIIHVLDRFANAIRDPTKEAFISDISDNESKSLGFGLRKGIGSMGTVLGGIAGYLLINKQILTGSQLYLLAIFPVCLACVILFFMFISKSKDKNSSLKSSSKESVFKLILSVGLCALTYKLQLIKYASLVLILIPILLFKKINKVNLIFNCIFGFLVLLMQYFIFGYNFINTNNNILYLIYLLNLLIGLFLQFNILSQIKFSLEMPGFNFQINNFFNFIKNLVLLIPILGKKCCYLMLKTPQLKIFNNLFDDSFEYHTILFQGILFKITEKESFISRLFYILSFLGIKRFFMIQFLGESELENLIFSFFSCLILIISFFAINFFKKHLENKMAYIGYFLINLILMWNVNLMLNNILVSFLQLSLNPIRIILLLKVLFRIKISAEMFSKFSKESFLEYVVKNLLLDLLSLLFLFKSENIYTFLFIIYEFFYNYNIMKFKDLSLFKIQENNKSMLYHFAIFGLFLLIENMYSIKNAQFQIVSFVLFGIFSVFYKQIIKIIKEYIGIDNLLISAFFVFTGIFENTISSFYAIPVLIQLIINQISKVFPLIKKLKLTKLFLKLLMIYWIFIFFLDISNDLQFQILKTNSFDISYDITKISNLLIVLIYDFFWIYRKNILHFILNIGLLIFCQFQNFASIFEFNFNFLSIIYYIIFSILVLRISQILMKPLFKIMKNSHIIKSVTENKEDFNKFKKILSIFSILSLCRFSEAVYFQRAIDLNLTGESVCLILSLIYFCISISSIFTYSLENKFFKNEINIKIILILVAMLFFSNIFITGILPIMPLIAYVFSIILYGLFVGSFDTILTTVISKSTNKKNLLGTLFGIEYFVSGIFNVLTTMISYLILKHFGTAACGLFFSIPGLIVFFVLLFFVLKEKEKLKLKFKK